MSSIDPYLEGQYNNRQAVADHPVYLADWSDRSAAYRTTANVHLNQSYGNSEREILDIFPAKDPTAPVHIFIHGGYWQALNKDSFSFMAEAFNAQGETAAILNYDLCPKVTVEQIIQQVQKAIVWLTKNAAKYQLNMESVQITGHSAGGHLVAELLVTDWTAHGLKKQPFCKATSLSGLFDLTPLLQTSVNQALGLSEAQAKTVSPVLRKPDLKSETELNLIVGGLESDSYKQQSEVLASSWKIINQLNIQQKTLVDYHHFSILNGFLKQVYTPLV